MDESNVHKQSHGVWKGFQMLMVFLVKDHNSLEELYCALQRVVGTQD